MNVSFRWLRDLVPGLEDTPDELAARLALLGAPVEASVPLGQGMDGVVVARVEEVSEHPNADRLSLCRVHDGRESVQVVCGASNVRAGRLYPLARVGATLPGGPTIRKAKIRGETSRGMLCSAKELGLGADHAGILELPAELEPGRDLVEALGLDDVRMEIEVTANRGDLLSHVGVAREAAPDGVAGVRLPEVEGGAGAPEPGFERGGGEARGAGIRIRIEEPDLCRRYLGAVIRGVEVGPSPPWLVSRLRAVGARPVNNVVDATNYVLLELGHPLHAFDLATLEGPRIVVRSARAGERIRTLDGVERALDPEMLAICDASRPVAVAGVMGGEDSEVGAGTTDVLLECALFEPTSIRLTRRSLELSTDASHRFERWVDPEGAEEAILRAIEVVLAVAGGRLEEPVLDAHPRPHEPVRTTLRPERVERVLGVPFTREALRELLEPLGFSLGERGPEGEDGDGLAVAVPGWRWRDVTREIDVIEEVARRHGYDRFPADLRPFPPGTVPDHPLFALEARLRTLLVGRGCWEAQNPPLVGSEAGEVPLLNPVSARESHLRSSLLVPLVGNVEHNLARGVRDVRLFELGTVFRDSGEERPDEETRVGLVLTGRRTPPHWSEAAVDVDLWDLKGLLAELAREVVGEDAALRPGGPESHPLLEPAESFTVEDGRGEPVGAGGRVREGAIDAPAWAGPVWALELRLPPAPEPRTDPTVRPPPPFPGTERDLALLVPDALAVERVRATIEAAGLEHLTDVEIFDLYRGEGVPAGVRSVAFRLRFRSPERTLTDQEVEEATSALIERLRDELDIEPRGP